MEKIQLGDKVKCKHSGFTGIAVARSEFINGCIQIEVLPKVKKGNEMVEAQGIDELSLEVIKRAKKEIDEDEDDEEESNGGPNRKAFNQRGY